MPVGLALLSCFCELVIQFFLSFSFLWDRCRLLLAVPHVRCIPNQCSYITDTQSMCQQIVRAHMRSVHCYRSARPA